MELYIKIGDFMRKIRRKREKRKKRIIIISVFLFLIIMTSGYAAFSTNITINAKGNIKCNAENVKAKLLKVTTTQGDGLYKDKYEDGRYIYRGENPSNYIIFNNELWRIIALENDGTIKIIKNNILEKKLNYDDINNRDVGSNGTGGTYCAKSGNGCNIWASTQNMIGSPSEFNNGVYSGTVLKDATLNTYLNNDYYNSLNDDKQYIVYHDYYIGAFEWNQLPMSISNVIQNQISKEKKYIWNGKIGLASLTDILKASLEENTCQFENITNIPNNPDYYKCELNTYFKNGNTFYLINGRAVANEYVSLTLVLSNIGEIDDYGAGRENLNEFVIRPVVFLDSNIKICGEGTENNPYTIKN